MRGTQVRRALLGAVGALGLLVAPAQAASLVVDDNRTECPNAAFTSIQAAVDAAATGDTIAVCPGVYAEGDGGAQGLVIAKDLAIRGTGADEVFVQPDGGPDNSIFGDPAGDAAGPPLRDTVGNVVTVSRAHVDISGVTVRAADVAVETGIAYLDATGTIAHVRVTDIVQSAATNGPARFGIFQRGLGIVAFSTAATGDFPVAIAHTEVSGYNKGGILIDAAPGPVFARSGSRVLATITDSIVQGTGPQGASGIGQNGIQVSWGAAASIRRSRISDNFFGPDPTSAVGVLLVDADTAMSAISDDNLQSNSFGAISVDENFVDDGAPPPAGAGVVNAENSWWGNQNGPAPNLPATGLGDAVTTATIDAVPFATAPFAEPVAAGPPPDAPPSVRITAPADGSAVTAFAPDPAVVAATAADDVAVERVVFRAGTTAIGVDATPPYTARYAPSTDLAGTSQVLTATAFDTSGHSTADSVSVVVAGPAGAGVAGTSAAGDDRPPRVLFTAPDENALLRGGVTATIAVNAGDDRGVAGVMFLEDGRLLCTDRTAPYACGFRPRGADVGPNSLTAVATDTAGQTAAAVRELRVAQFAPRRLTAIPRPVRDRTRPWTFRTTGRLALPAGVTRAGACGAGVVSVQIRRGRAAISTGRVLLRPDCSYRSTIRLADRRQVGRTGRLRVVARFLGNAQLAPATSPTRRIRAG